MRIALVGCGYVADYYMENFPKYPDVALAGVFDRDEARLEAFTRFHGVKRYPSLAAVLGDTSVGLVVNLTNPSSHFEVSRAALDAGKHVYSEKPLAMRLDDAEELVRIAESKKLVLAGAPCTVLGEAAQTAWKALRDGRIGRPRLAYAEMDDGPLHLMNFKEWRSASGAPWPWEDEFKVGVTLEHAGYYLTWLCAFFGPAKRITSFASLIVPGMGGVEGGAPDFSVACLEFGDDVVARLTCSLYAPQDRGIRLIGDGGILHVEDAWDFGSGVTLHKRNKLGVKAEHHPKLGKVLPGLRPRSLGLVQKPSFKWRLRNANKIDFARGVAEAARAAEEGRACRLSARFALHVNELALATQHPEALGCPRELKTTFDPMEPMPWAR